MGELLGNQRMVRAMTNRMYRVLIASVGVVVLTLSASESFARSGGAPAGAAAGPRAMARPLVAPGFRHHHRNFGGGFFWPGDYGYGGYPSGGEPSAYVPPQTSQDIHYTYTYDVPWDWAHRFPPNVTPSDKPYVPTCPVETVTTTARDGSEQTVNVMRCY